MYDDVLGGRRLRLLQGLLGRLQRRRDQLLLEAVTTQLNLPANSIVIKTTFTLYTTYTYSSW